MTGALAVGCGGDDAPSSETPAHEADAIDYELFDSTRELHDVDLAALATSDDTGTLVFTSEPPALAGVDSGQVLLAPASAKTPMGLLRVVTSVERNTPAGALVVHTAAAPLQVAFKRLHARIQRTADTNVAPLSPTDISPLYTVVKGRGEKTQSYEFVIYDGDGDVETKNDQVAIDTTLGGGFDYTINVDVDWGAIDKLPDVVTECLTAVAKIVTGQKPSCSIDDLVPEAKTTFVANPFIDVDVNARGAATLAFEKNLEVGVINLPPVPLGPLVFVPTVDVVAKVEGGASARFEAGASAHAKFETSVVVSSKSLGQPQYSPPKLVDSSFDPREPTVDLHASAKASVGARLNVSLYGVVGPYATASGVLEINADPLKDPCWNLRFAMEGDLGVRITSPRLPIIGYVTLADFHAQPFRPFDKEVARGSCTIPPDPPNVPGSGPTPKTYASPTFVPWAKMLPNTFVDGITSATGGFFTSSDLVASIDGRFIASGGYAMGFHKLDDTGALTWGLPLRKKDATLPLRALRSVPSADAGLFLLLEPQDLATFVLAKTGQSGALEWSRVYTLDIDCGTSRGVHLLRDNGSGTIVTGTCTNGEAFFARLDAKGDVVRARMLSEEGSVRIVPVAAVTSDGDVVLTGSVMRPSELEWTFVSRFDADDKPTPGTAFHCPDRIAMQPTAMIPAENGGVTVVGNANGLGYVARVRKDGALGFTTFPNAGAGVAADFTVGSVAELSTTGMVIAASHRNVSENTPPFVVLAGLDSGGRTLWSRKYEITQPAPRPLALPAIRLTDDGGILAVAVAGPEGGRDGDLYAMKVHAKDGNLGDGTALTSSPIVLDDFVCSTVARTFAPAARDVNVTVAALPLERR